eukprot:Platyproteum_vivax@DN3417_c0_g1_i1.p1
MSKERITSMRCVLRKAPWIDKNRTNNSSPGAQVIIGTPLVFYVPCSEWGVLMLVCKSWLAELMCFSKLKHWIRQGLGKKERAIVWEMLLCTHSIRTADGQPLPYNELVKTQCLMDSDIQRDIGRTFPDHPNFQQTKSKGQQSLHRVLRAVGHRLSDVGYCQGMNFVAGTLLRVLSEELAYRAMIYMLVRYRLECFYLPQFPKLQVMIFQLDRLVEAFLPKLHNSFQRFNLSAEYYAVQWFLTLFSYDLPEPVLLRVWDSFLLFGWKTIFRVSLALLYICQEKLCVLEFDECLRELKVFTKNQRVWNPDVLLKTANSFKVSNRMLQALAKAYKHTGGGILFVLKDLDSGKFGWEVVEEKVRLEGVVDEGGRRIPTDAPSTYLDCDLSPPYSRKTISNPFNCLVPKLSNSLEFKYEPESANIQQFGYSRHSFFSDASKDDHYGECCFQKRSAPKMGARKIHRCTQHGFEDIHLSDDSSIYEDENDESGNLLLPSTQADFPVNGGHKRSTTDSLRTKDKSIQKPKIHTNSRGKVSCVSGTTSPQAGGAFSLCTSAKKGGPEGIILSKQPGGKASPPVRKQVIQRPDGTVWQSGSDVSTRTTKYYNGNIETNLNSCSKVHPPMRTTVTKPNEKDRKTLNSAIESNLKPRQFKDKNITNIIEKKEEPHHNAKTSALPKYPRRRSLHEPLSAINKTRPPLPPLSHGTSTPSVKTCSVSNKQCVT